MPDFLKLKIQLNPQQLAAVETIEGSVMVLAGPGTGKTQVVAMRIAEILQRTQVGPRNILALTFTEAGVTALRTRLESIIGPDAYQVTITTFHGFSNEIIGTFPYLFNLDETAQRLSDLDRLVLLEEIVSSLNDLGLLRPVKVPTIHVNAIGTAIRTAKQEAVTPARLEELAQADLAEAETVKSKLEREKKTNNAQKNLELAAIYAAYEKALEKRSQYDYEDMILRVVAQLQTNEELRLHFQERYQYILVDEYQDTNNSQNALVETLANFFVSPNLFVVGDDKQAIYRFQGASVANMLHFAKKYPSMKIINLQQNYRSTPEILASADQLIGYNSHQLGKFIPEADGTLLPTKPAGPAPQLVKLPTVHSQYGWIIREVKQLEQAGTPLSQIAVLFRLNEQVRAFRTLAEKFGLNLGGTLQSNLINEPETSLLITVLQAIDNPLLDALVAATGRVLVESVDLLDLLEIISPQERTNQHLIRRIIQSTNKNLQKMAQLILELHQQSQKMPLVEFFEHVLVQTKILERIRCRPDHLDGLELISAFLDEARNFSLRQPSAKLGDFLNYLTTLKKYRLRLTVNRILPERDGLFVSTIHGAKGLEFGAVFMADIDEIGWATRKNRSVISLPAEIVELKDWADDQTEDDRRLFYVGLTRAKDRLYLTHSAVNDDGREILPCQFVSELASTVESFSPILTAPEIDKLYSTHLQPLPSAMISAHELAYMRERIASQPFSYTDMSTFQLCPKQYLLTRILRLPSEPTIPLIYGNAVHRALELFFRSYRAQKDRPSAQALVNFFNQALNEQPALEHEAAIRAQGEQVLRAYWAKYAQTWPVPEGVEYSFRAHHVRLNDIWLTGKYDRLEPLDVKTRSVRVIDYKTVSRLPSRNQIEGNTKNSDDHYKKQLTFYALLAESDRLFPYQAKEFVLSFLDDQQKFKDEVFSISKAETAALAEEITKTYREILSLEHFEHTRDEFDRGCELCAAFTSL